MKLRTHALLFCALAVLPITSFSPLPAFAQDAAEEAAATDNATRAASLINEAATLAENNIEARAAFVRGAAALLPRLPQSERDALSARWLRLLNAPTSTSLTRATRLDAYESFFESANRVQGEEDYSRRMALYVPDNAARTGALLQLSRATQNANFPRAVEYSNQAQIAARKEEDELERARALTFVAYNRAQLNTLDATASIQEAVRAARALPSSRERDYLLAEIVGAASRYDLPMARRIADSIGDENLKSLAVARTNIAEASQTTLTVATAERISTLAKAAARYDVRAIPVLLQLPAQPDVLKALSDALPPIYPSARPSISPVLLERMWTYAQNAKDPSAQRDELQSRLARLMVLHDMWRGRDWGKQLAWKGGRIQVGAFLNEVLKSRQSRVKAMPLHDVAKQNVNGAIAQARGLADPSARVEALLLIAGQLLG